MKTIGSRQRGVSLIEALVAMAVMAFGMLALLGLQGTLRGNADISKQRAEAVRIAQQKLEQKRGFSVLSHAVGTNAFDDIVTEAAAAIEVADYLSSATFTRRLTITDLPLLSSPPTEEELYYLAGSKQVAVEVTWPDRNGEAQAVQLNTIVARTAPEIIGALSVAGTGSLVQQPGRRNINIPPGAVALTGEPGKSAFNPPGIAPGTAASYWKFDNSTGRIVGMCENIDTVELVVVTINCNVFNGLLLSGYIRYAVSGGQPASLQSETPLDLALPVADVITGLVVHLPAYSDAVDSRPLHCYVSQTPSAFGAYYCAVPVGVGGQWSGRSTVTFNRCWSTTIRHDGTLPPLTDPNPNPDWTDPDRCIAADAARFAASITDSSSTRFRVCRYTTRRDQSVVTESSPPFFNFEHPLNYLDVNTSLSNQNFLVIRAGNGTIAYPCPDDDAATPLNGRTWHHQPAPAV